MQCDRCTELYKVPTHDEMPYGIHGKNAEDPFDLCPACKYELEDFVDNWQKHRKTSKRKKTTHVWSDEAKDKQSERMKKRTNLAS